MSHQRHTNQAGVRVRLLYTDDPYTRLKHGDLGVVRGKRRLPASVDPLESWQVSVEWDNGSNLMLIEDKDQWEELADEF